MTAAKTAVLHIRVTADEKRAIQQAAKRAKLTVSAWLRAVSTDQLLATDGGYHP